MPALVRREGRIVATVGTMGGKNQPTIVAQVIARILAGESAQDAVNAPRWVLPVPDDGGEPVLFIEDSMPEPARTFLMESGFPTLMVPGLEGQLGHSQAIVATSPSRDSGTDRRADGTGS
jgi:gamma-glutamyltranspeptidase/glutathione hydrolase